MAYVPRDPYTLSGSVRFQDCADEAFADKNLLAISELPYQERQSAGRNSGGKPDCYRCGKVWPGRCLWLLASVSSTHAITPWRAVVHRANIIFISIKSMFCLL